MHTLSMPGHITAGVDRPRIGRAESEISASWREGQWIFSMNNRDDWVGILLAQPGGRWWRWRRRCLMRHLICSSPPLIPSTWPDALINSGRLSTFAREKEFSKGRSDLTFWHIPLSLGMEGKEQHQKFIQTVFVWRVMSTHGLANWQIHIEFLSLRRNGVVHYRNDTIFPWDKERARDFRAWNPTWNPAPAPWHNWPASCTVYAEQLIRVSTTDWTIEQFFKQIHTVFVKQVMSTKDHRCDEKKRLTTEDATLAP
jgi:hypothetical protein